MLSNWKLYLLSFALIGALTLNVLLKYQNLKLDGNLQVCNANLAASNIAIQAANEMRTRQEQRLKLREQEAAQARAESLKRRDKILNMELPGDCENLNNWMIEQALGFHWDNNIP